MVPEPKATTRSKRTPNPKASTDSFGLPAVATLRRLKLSKEVAYYLVSRGIPLPECPPLIQTPDPGKSRGALFDPDRVDKALNAFKHLRHTQGQLAGSPLNPDPWQIAYLIAPVMGWVRKNSAGRYVRIVRNLYVEVSRKNGKSTICGGLALYLTAADGEPGAQVIAAATTKAQAGFVFEPVKQLALSAPALRGRLKPLIGRIVHPRTNSTFSVISAAADAQHGANLHGAVIDELHIHKKADLVEAIETGTGSRDQPLIVIITTADAGKPKTIYARKRRFIEQLARNVFKDPSTYGVIFAAEESDDPFAEETWRKANPGFPISPTRDYIVAAAARAKNSPIELASFKRLHLGLRTKQTTAFLDLGAWDRNAGKPIDWDELDGLPCFGGLDLGSVSDLTALCWLFPDPGTGGYRTLFRFWTPEDNVEELDKRTAGSASLWVDQGWLSLTPGNVTDYDVVKADILADADRFDVVSLGFDRWAATQTANDLQGAGVPLVKVGQGFLTMSPAMKEMQRLTLKGKRGTPMIQHGGNPVMRWMIDNLAVDIDAAGNVKPNKAHSADKIDGVAALANAISEAMNTAIVRSSYEDHGLIVA